MKLLKRIFSHEGMIKKEAIEGPIPSDKELYLSVLTIAWPSALENLLIALISAVDMMMVGSLGKEAISAVGIVSQPRMICLAPIFAINTSIIVFTARRKGQGLRDEANDYMKIGLILSTLVSVLICSLSYLYAEEILTFAGAKADYLAWAVEYFRIVLVSLIPFSIGITMTAAQRGIGRTKISMETNLTANIFNIIFNYLLIGGHGGFPALGVKGAAIATAIGNVVSFFIACGTLLHRGAYLELTWQRIEHFKDKLQQLLSVGANTFIEQVFLRVGFFLYAKVVAGLGTADFAAHQLCMNIMSISFALGNGLQVANTSLVGQALGAKRRDLAIIKTRISQVIGIIFALTVSLIISLAHKPILLLFTSDLIVVAKATVPMVILALTVFFQIPQVIIVGSLRGAGDVKFVAWMMLVSVGFIRPICGYLFTYTFSLGLLGAWAAILLDQLTRFAISYSRFKTGKWLKMQI